MTLVIALADLAERISRLIEGPKFYVLKVSDEKELRRKVCDHRPEVLLLDSRVGGNRWRAIDQVPAILRECRSVPSVIALLPHTSKGVEREAARLGCYDVVPVNQRSFDRDLLMAVSTAMVARSAADELPNQCARAGLH